MRADRIYSIVPALYINFTKFVMWPGNRLHINTDHVYKLCGRLCQDYEDNLGV